MSLTKSKGNMYDWVTHTHAHLAGECQHKCGYCYVQAMRKRFPAMREKYSGPVRLVEKELDVNYGSGKTIFIDHLNDLFAENVPKPYIASVLDHCFDYPGNIYVFQTKNPKAYQGWGLSRRVILGTTIETNRRYECMGNTPTPDSRAAGIEEQSSFGNKTFITIEPILDFDLDGFAEMLIWAKPGFVNIGADSKGNGLPEPPFEKVMALYERLLDAGIEVRKKVNLERLAGCGDSGKDEGLP